MKKKGLAVYAAILIVTLCMALVACSGGESPPSSKTSTSIYLVNTSLRTDYIVGEKLDLSGAKLMVTYNDNTEEVVSITPEIISGFDTESAGEKSAVVTYASRTTKYYYQVAAARVEPDYFDTFKNVDGSLTILSVKEECPSTIYVPGTLNGSPVRTIASEAFKNVKAKRIVVEEGVTTINSQAFANNPNIDFVTLPDSVTSLGQFAFWGCMSLEEVTFGNGITELAKGVVYDCPTLVRVTLPSALKTVGTNAFYYCSALDEIDLPETVTTVEDGAFWNCTRLKNISLPNVTEIKANTFLNCYKLKSATLPKVTTIGNNAFEKAGFSEFDFPAVLTSIGDNAFSEVPLVSVSLPEGIKTLGENAFKSPFESKLQQLFLPSTLEAMGAACFSGQHVLTKVTIAETSKLTTISENSFAGCATLKEFKLPSSITTIGMRAFDSAGYMLEGDDSFVLDLSAAEKLERIDFSAFLGARLTGTFTVPKSVTAVGSNAFSNTKIDALIFPQDSALTNADNLAYGNQSIASNCENLKKIVFPPVSVYKYKWTENTVIEEIDLTNTTISELPFDVFNRHGKLKSIRLPKSLTKIDRVAFSGKTVAQIFFAGTLAEWDAVDKKSGWMDGLADGYTVSYKED